MVLIQDIAQKALNTGYLSLADQNQIQVLLKTNFDSEDLDALIILQRAIASGNVIRESQRRQSDIPENIRDKKPNIKLAYRIAAEMTFAAAMALTSPKNSPDQPSLGT